MVKKAIIPTAAYSVKEAAEVVGMYWQTIGDKVTAGEIKSKLVGNKHMILGEYLLDWLKGKEPENNR